MAKTKQQPVVCVSTDSLKDISKMILATLTFSIITSYWFAPVQGATVPYEVLHMNTDKDSESTDNDKDDEDEDEGSVFGYRYIWPFVFAAIAAGIFASIYSCSKKGKCCQKCNEDHAMSTPNSSRPTRDPTSTSRRRTYNNNGFMTDDLDDGSPDHAGRSATEPTVIEMQPPPYCEKPPDYGEIFGDSGSICSIPYPGPEEDTVQASSEESISTNEVPETLPRNDLTPVQS